MISKPDGPNLLPHYGSSDMQPLNITDKNGFSEKHFTRLLVHESPYFKILNFNFQPGQEMPLHSHQLEGEVCLSVLEGEGEFLGEAGAVIPAKAGDVLVCPIATPHGLRAKTALRLLVHIAPPI